MPEPGKSSIIPIEHSSDAILAMSSYLEEFRRYRERMNGRILASGNLQIKRFFNLDSRAYEAGALPVKVKELLGLTASMVLRCDDCVTYHVVRCVEEGVSDAEFLEAFNVALVVGGSITIPHLRRAVERLEECRKIGLVRLQGTQESSIESGK